MNWDAMKRVVMMAGDDTFGYFECIGDAARMVGIYTSNMTSRIKTGYTKDGLSFRFVKNGESLTDIPCLSPERKRGQKFVVTEKMPKQTKPKKERKSVFEDDNTELNRDKYLILKYEVRNFRECITPCPFKESPKPMIGSAACIKCSSFKGRNRTTHEIACKHPKV